MVKLVFLRCSSVRPAWFQPLRHYRGCGTSTLSTPRRKTPCLPFRKSRRLLSALRPNARKDSGHCRWRVNVHRLSTSGRAESEDAAYSADILRKLRMTSLPATSSDAVNNGSKASGNSGKHQPSAPSAHYTSEKVAPTSLGMSLFLDAPLPPGTDRCCLS